MNTTLDGHHAQVLKVTRFEIFEDEPISEKLLREHRVPAVSFNVDLAEPIAAERMFQRIDEGFRGLGLETERVASPTAPHETFSRMHLYVRSRNRRTKEVRDEKLIVVIVEGKFVSVTSFS